MTLEEKLAQIATTSYHQLIDIKTLEIRKTIPEKYFLGVGHMERLSGSNDLSPYEVARAQNEIQRFVLTRTRNKIPVLFLTEGTSCLLGRGHTIFPGNLNLGATFDHNLTGQMANAIRKEAMAVGNRYILGPVVDVIRDHRYGRYEESFSEDTYVTTQHGLSYIKALQTDDLKQGVAATLKHFAGQGISDGGRNTAPIHCNDREFYDQYLYPFKACIDEGKAASVMVAYHEIDGVPCHASHHLLQEILNKRLGFSGMIISDGNGVQLLESFQEYCRDLYEATIIAMNAGIHIEIGQAYKENVLQAIENKEITMKLLDEACYQMLDLKRRLGLFDNPFVEVEKVAEQVQNQEHIELSQKIAEESIVLLKNDKGILPLDQSKYKKVAVVGPLIKRKEFALGDYSYPTHIYEMLHHAKDYSEEDVIARSLVYNVHQTPYHELFNSMSTVYEGLQNEFSNIDWQCSQILKDTYNYNKEKDFESYEELQQFKQVDLFVIVVGDTSGMGYKNDTGESVDSVRATLAEEQLTLISEVRKMNKPVIIILANGRPYVMDERIQGCDVILEAFKLGQQGAEALAKVMSGRVNPSGKLPVSLPQHIGQLPIYYSQRITGHKQFWHNKYLEMSLLPAYPFGYGLSYTQFKFAYISHKLDDHGIQIYFSIENTGKIEGKEVIQVYTSKKFTSVTQPSQQLSAYKKINILPSQIIICQVELSYDSLGYTTLSYEYGIENCELTITIGNSSVDKSISIHELLKFENGFRLISQPVYTNEIITLEE